MIKDGIPEIPYAFHSFLFHTDLQYELFFMIESITTCDTFDDVEQENI